MLLGRRDAALVPSCTAWEIGWGCVGSPGLFHGQSLEGAVFLGKWSGQEEEGAVLGGAFWNGEAEQVLGLGISKSEEERGLAIGKCSSSKHGWEGVTPKYTAHPTGNGLHDIIP